jgi:menaquinone-dependent protoporphyrinogen oxidase
MKPVGVLYSTRAGQTQKIAQHVVSKLRALGLESELRIVTKRAAAIDLGRYSGVILAASVHAGKHEHEMVRFVGTHLSQLSAMRTAFLSVSLSQAGAERAGESPERRRQFVADVEKMVSTFITETSWHPQVVMPVAGALLYRGYNPLVRWIMKIIARKAGGHTDASRNYEYTDWAALERFVEEWAVTNAKVMAGPQAA